MNTPATVCMSKAVASLREVCHIDVTMMPHIDLSAIVTMLQPAWHATLQPADSLQTMALPSLDHWSSHSPLHRRALGCH